MGNINFLDYDKISDTMMYLSRYVTLNFCVSLSHKSTTTNKMMSFHSEYTYSNNNKSKCYSIKRNFNMYFLINDVKDFNNSVMIRPQDVVFLQMVLQNNVIPWFMGNKRLFFTNEEGKIYIKGKYNQVDFPISDYKYIAFLPIVYTYENGDTKEGIRIILNNKENFIDIDVNKFMEFYYFIQNTDMYCAATNLLNYVKTEPYGENMMDINNGFSNGDYSNYEEDWNAQKKSGKKNFFDKL